ncbi:MAG: hypothetical protein Kow0049_16430 [Stanieria sp.]
MHFGDSEPILWCDSDILWFKELSSLPTGLKKSSVILKTTEDFQQSYDPNLLEQKLKHLHEFHFVNTGLVFLKGNLLEACKLKNLINCASKNPHHFSEQTILAEAAYQLRQNYWTLEEINCSYDSYSLILPTFFRKKWVAKHYVSGIRHQLWQDAFALRIKSIFKI